MVWENKEISALRDEIEMSVPNEKAVTGVKCDDD